MVRFETKVYEKGMTVIPDEIRDELNLEKGKKLIWIANARAAVVFPKDASWDEVEESLMVILSDIKIRKKREGG